MTIRPADTHDIPAWLALRAALSPDSSEQDHRREMSELLESTGIVLLAELGFRETARTVHFVKDLRIVR